MHNETSRPARRTAGFYCYNEKGSLQSHQFFLDRQARGGNQSLYPSGEIAHLFETVFINQTCVIKQFQPALCLNTFFPGNSESKEHIGQTVRILPFADVCENAGGRSSQLRSRIRIPIN